MLCQKEVWKVKIQCVSLTFKASSAASLASFAAASAALMASVMFL